jgi:hypothetical protein
LRPASLGQTISKKLSYFNPNHSDRYDPIDQMYKFLSRGLSLTHAAVDWENPAICGSKRNNTGKGLETEVKFSSADGEFSRDPDRCFRKTGVLKITGNRL